jgi:WD40 repeat protein
LLTELKDAHGGVIEQLAWSPDGTRLASVSKDGRVKLWGIDG